MFSQRHSVFFFVFSLYSRMLFEINAQQQYNHHSATSFERYFVVNNEGDDSKSDIKPHNNITRRNENDSNKNVIKNNNNNSVLKHQQQQTEWKPLTAQKKWFILQTTVATPEHENSHKQSHPYQQSHQYQQSQQQQRLPSLPVNYYGYNHGNNDSNGNYRQVVTQSALPVNISVNVNTNNSNNIKTNEVDEGVVNAIPLQHFVFAIDNSLKHNNSAKQSSRLMSHHSKNLLNKNITPRKFNGGDIISTDANREVQQQKQNELNQKMEMSTLYIGSNGITTTAKLSAERPPTQEVTDNDNKYVLRNHFKCNDNAIRINEFLVPFDTALQTARHFFDSFIINDNDSVKNDDKTDNEIDDPAKAQLDIDFIRLASNKVQGRGNVAGLTASLPVSKISSKSSLSTFSGSSRKVKKLKRKFKKLLLPLLIAYKLKFLTLIPVLIGGLTLLVGTTGLAGFFFALFTAVMSLKSTSGSKSLIVKKIY